MPLVLADRVRDTTTTTGTGTVALSGTAPTGYQNFSVIGNGNTTYYTINAGSQWEVGIGTYSSTGPTLARNTVLESSNANALVDFAAGTKDVFVTYPADKSVNYDESNNVGIGTTSPGAKLDVNGQARASTLYATSTTASSFTSRLTNDPEFQLYALNGVSGGGSGSVKASLGLYYDNNIANLNAGIQFTRGGAGLDGWMNFLTSGTERMRIASAGNIGIGTSTPAAKLDVQGTDGVSGIIVRDSATTNIFDVVPIASNGALVRVFDNAAVSRVQFTAYGASYFNAGNVGIGTTSPSDKLEVSGAAAGGAVTTRITNTDATGFGSLSFFDNTGARAQIWAGGASYASFGGAGSLNYSANSGPHVWYTNYTERMRIDSSGNLLVGTTTAFARLAVNGSVFVGAGNDLQVGNVNNTNAASINSDSTDTSAALVFKTASAGLARTERMRITSDGNVGIACTPLSVTRFQTSIGTDRRFSVFLNGSDSVFGFLTDAGNWTDTFLNGTPLRFGISGTERMRIDSSGNVGIGTTTPDIFGRFYTRSVGINSSGTTMLQINGTTYGGIDLGFNGTRTANILAETAGFYLQTVTASPMVFVTNTAERMRITSAGNVGVGTASPTRLLSVAGTANGYMDFSASSFRRYTIGSESLGFVLFDDTAAAYRMVVDGSGNVGVNLTTPGTTFDVALSTTGLPGLRASRSGAPSQYIQMDIGGGASARLFATGANKAMFITNNNSGAGLGTATDSTFIQVPGPTANTPITAMYLESSTANVGIGTTAPAGRVHAVNSYTNTSDATFIAGGNIPGINLRPANGRFSLLASYGAANTSSIVLGTGTANPSTEAMRFDHSTGGVNVGAATPNAAAQLQVDSTTRGFLPPRMTTAQRDAIATPPNGLVLYNTSTDKLQVRAAGAWVDLH